MVQQHAEIVADFTVAENVTLCDEPRRFGFLFDRSGAEARVAALAAENGFRLDPAARASGLSIAERQQLEILKLLYRKAGILILDEPTAVLAESEVDALFATLRRLKAAGKTIIIITHKVREVRAIADSVTVMRQGRTVARLEAVDLGEAELAALMMGEQESSDPGPKPGPRGPATSGRVVFEMRDIRLLRRGAHRPVLDGVSLQVRAGEILGVCGLAGNGLSELEDLAAGYRRPGSGRVLLDGRRLPRLRNPSLGYVPADRLWRGSSLDSAVEANLAVLDRSTFFPRGISDPARIRGFALKAIEGYGIAALPEQRLGSLSGGGIQKVILARELAGDADFLLFSNPTWGLDLASTSFVYGRILEARARGAAILLVSANLDEVLALADRIAVMSRGRIALELENGSEVDRGRIGGAMLGALGCLDAESQAAAGGEA
jgi:simple sugar transport system ATP-binding protein